MAARAASADDFVGSLRFSGRREVAREPELWLDPVLRTHFEGLVQDTERHESEFVVGDTRIILQGIASANVDRVEGPAVDVPSRSWRTGVHVTHSFGPIDLDVWAMLDGVQTRFGGGTYRDIGVSLSHKHKFSRWVTAWIALTIGTRKWLGDEPPPGEANGTAALLSIGTTFR